MTNRIFLKLLAAFMVVIAAAALIFNFAIRGAWESSLRSEIERNLMQKTLLFARRVEADRTRKLTDIASQEGQAAGARATIIDVTGKVLADSETDPASMQNPASLKEFVAALAGNVGVDERRNANLRVPFLYVAAPISGGAVRLAYPLSDVEAVSGKVERGLALASALAFVVALLIAGTVASLNARRRQDASQNEIGRIGATVDSTAGHIEPTFAAVRSSQHQLETLLNSMQDAVIAISADGRVQWANQSMDRLMPQRTRLQAPVVETIRDPDFLAAIKSATEAHEVMTARATSIIAGRAFDVTAAPLPDGGAVAVLRDLTETERVEKTRRDFIANVSHELRTPLTSIQGYSETLLDTGTENGAHSREFIEIIRKNAARMSRLTEDLLTLARVESGETRFDIEPVAPVEMLHDAEESFREIARSHGIDLQIEEIGGAVQTLPPVLADREAIHQAFANLIDNALKYGASGGRIVLGARLLSDTVEFYVRDFGSGISSEHLPRLFERFYRIDKARSRESGGTGLGLAIVKHIMLAHGGSIRAESELNHGSSFVFTLPTAESPQ